MSEKMYIIFQLPNSILVLLNLRMLNEKIKINKD